MRRCMMQVDTRPSHAEVLADNLSMADYRGKRTKRSTEIDSKERFLRSLQSWIESVGYVCQRYQIGNDRERWYEDLNRDRAPTLMKVI